jgi:hypothetical protein
LLSASGSSYKLDWQKSNRFEGLFSGFGHPDSVTKIFSSVKTACYKPIASQGYIFEKTGQKRRKSALLGEMTGVQK